MLRLESLRVDALEEHFEAALALGDHLEIVADLRTALAENPFRERLWGQLMLALYRSGRQPDALEAFGEARRVLSDELALEPGPDLRRLQEAILTQDPAVAYVPRPRTQRGNLPAPSTSFVGREEALAQIVALVGEHRLVTLTGPPGVGKSRLALEVARSLQDDVRGGAWRVDLGRASNDDAVVRLVARAVDARGADPLTRVVGRLRTAEAILMLDGCGHVAAEVGRVAAEIIAGCPAVRVIATSREVLRVPGEVRVTVEPLDPPGLESNDGAGSPAVQLFVERARAARPGFELTADDAPLVAEITRQLDGLPLAIELAAARAHALGLAEILALVERRIELLQGRPTSDANRAAVETLIEWSYNLLHADEMSMLHQVAVHRGGASLPSLAAAAARLDLDEATAAHLLGVLVDKSILSVSFPPEGVRYDLLDTVREYALGRLADSGGLAAAREGHAQHFATLAHQSRVGLRGGDWQSWVRRLDLENENLWAALTCAREASHADVAARLASLAWYYVFADRVSEGRRFVELALAAAADSLPVEERLEILAVVCFLATEELDLGAAVAIGEQALAMATDVPTVPPIGLVQATLALAVAQTGDVERGSALAEQACHTLVAGDDDWAIAAASLLRAQIAACAGDVPTVAAMAADAYRIAEARGLIAFCVPAKLLDAWVAERTGDVEAATDGYGRALDLAGSVGMADHAAFALSAIASGALASGELARAEEIGHQALATAEAAHAPWAAAHARVGLGRILAATGDTEAAALLYESVVAWSEVARPHGSREGLFVAMSADPAAAALAGLAELDDDRVAATT